MFGETVPSELPSKMCLTIRLPVGLVGLITPWNFPMAIPGWKSGAALIAGCPIVLKPSSLTPLCAAKFVEVLDEAGFPPGVVNMLTGSGSVVGDGLVAHPDIRAISFTGGVDTGKHVYESAAKKMIKVGLELGGKNAIIAMDDADLDLLMDGVMFGAFGTAGQRCTATSRLIVHEAIYDRVVDDLVARAEELRIGNPLDETTDMGPVASPDQEAKVLEYIEIGKKEGDTLLTGGKKLAGGAYDRGFYIAPTVFAVDPKKRLAQEEIFGPVLSVLKARDYDDAVAIANSVKYGLSSSIYTNDLRWSFRAMQDLNGVLGLLRASAKGPDRHGEASRWVVAVALSSIRHPNDQLQAGPDRVDRRDLDVDEPGVNRNLPHMRLRQVRRDGRCLLRPRDPDHSRGLDPAPEVSQLPPELVLASDEYLDEIEIAGLRTDDPDSLRQGPEDLAVSGRRPARMATRA